MELTIFFFFLALVLLCIILYLFAFANKYTFHFFVVLMLIVICALIVLLSFCLLFFVLCILSQVEIYNISLMDFSSPDMLFMNGPSANPTDAVDLSNVTQESVWIDLKIVNRQGSFYLIDSTQKSGANLLAQIQAESSQVVTTNLEKLSIGNGLKVNFNDSNTLQLKTIEGTVYKGYYCDVGFNNASITSANLPTQKNEDGHTFVVWRKFAKRII